MYTVFPESRLVSVKFEKRLSIEDIQSYVSALGKDPLFDCSFSELIDLRDVEELDMSSDNALSLADVVDPYAAGVKRAFVARSEMQVHAARMHQILRNDEENIRIFPTLEEARQWLGI